MGFSLKSPEFNRLIEKYLGPQDTAERHSPKRNYAPYPIFTDFIVVDLETTGLSPGMDKIIEIAAIKINNHQIVDTYTSLVNPLIHIPSRITKITGITDDMVFNAPTIDSIINDFWSFAEDLPLVAHNASFEAGFLEAVSPKIISPLYADTLRFSRNYFGHLPNHKLGTICQHLEIINDARHRAMGDCMATVELYLKCKSKYEIQR